MQEAKVQPGSEVRTCLKCNRDFYSYGPHNRICPKCRSSKDSYQTGVPNRKC